ncbi:MAG: hypothetical protein M3515_01465 [Actinomycetota bacterium]|nr:hypothetical protein [Actinomycetota bacterium]
MKDRQLGFQLQDPYRESLIESVLSKSRGIYGAEVCQLCGRQRTFHGWAGAMATHRYGRFSCSKCVRDLGEDEARRLLRGCTTGFCEGCRKTGAASCGQQFLCDQCRAVALRQYPESEARDVLQGLSRRRNLEQRTTESLEALDLNSEVARLLKAETLRRERARKARLARLARNELTGRRRGGVR